MCFSRLVKCENRFNKYIKNYTVTHCNASKLTINTEFTYEEFDLTHFNPPFPIANNPDNGGQCFCYISMNRQQSQLQISMSHMNLNSR